MFNLWGLASVADEVKVGVLLPQGSQSLEKDLPQVIEQLNKECQSRFTQAGTWHYKGCSEAAKKAGETVVNQVKVLFTDGCFADVNNILNSSANLPYPVSPYTGADEITEQLRKYCGNQRPVILGEYTVSVPFALLRIEIPVDEQRNYQADKGTIVAKLANGDAVAENPKESSGQYKDKACQPPPKQGQTKPVHYDWLLTQDWKCVTVKQAQNPDSQNKVGWIHRLLIAQKPGSP